MEQPRAHRGSLSRNLGALSLGALSPGKPPLPLPSPWRQPHDDARARHPFLAFRPSSAAAHLAGLAGAAAARSLAALAAARSLAAAFSASSGPLLAGASPISMAPLCPSPSASLSSSGRISSVLSLAACSSSSACRSRSAASTAAFSANSFCFLSMSTWSLQASSSLPSFARARPHLVPSALNAWHLGSSSTHSPSSCGGRR